jgi:hypothetical protein
MRTRLQQSNSNPKTIKGELNLGPCARSVRRVQNTAGQKHHIQQYTPIMNEETIRKRLSFGEGYWHKTEEDWADTIFLDETIFTTNDFGSGHVNCEPGEQYLPENTKPRESHPASINAWLCFNRRGRGVLLTFPETMDGKYYKRILKNCLFESVRSWFGDKSCVKKDTNKKWWLLCDNSGPHRETIVKQWIEDNNINRLDFPPYSPDLNPIEHLIGITKAKVALRNPRTLDELVEAVFASWDEITEELCEELSDSMCKRTNCVLESGGSKIFKHK